jgi:hypothetical protein
MTNALLITLLVQWWFNGVFQENVNPEGPGNSKTIICKHARASEMELDEGLCVASAGRDGSRDQ